MIGNMVKNIMKETFLLFVITTIFNWAHGGPIFIVTPSNPTYAEVGGNALLNWTYSYSRSTIFKRWYQVTSQNDQIGKNVMFKSSSSAAEVKKDAFKGRAEYRENGGLFIKNISLLDEGYMSFSVNFDDGESLSNRVMLNITIPPSVTSALPKEVVAIEGKSSTMQCTFQARPRPIVSWKLNGNTLVNGSRVRVVSRVIGFQNNMTIVLSTLTIHNVIEADSGNISCSADIPLKDLSTKTQHLVWYPPKNSSFISDRTNHIAVVGETALLTCRAKAVPMAYYQIYHNSKLISNSTNETLEIRNLDIFKEGNYRCVPVNNLGEGHAVELNLTVQVSPVLHSFSGDNIRVIETKSVHLSCIFYGEPTPVITWQKTDGSTYRSMNSTSRISMINSSFAIVESTLAFSAAKKTDFGNYRCKAVNKVGMNEKNVTLDVLYSPEFIEQLPAIQYVPVGTANYSLTCTIVSHPASTIQWYNNGVPFSPNSLVYFMTSHMKEINHTRTTSMMTIEPITKADFANYSCNATNEVGSAVSKNAFIVTYKPEIIAASPQQITLNATKNTLMMFDFESNPLAHTFWRRKLSNEAAFSTFTNVTSIILHSSMQFYRIRSQIDIKSAHKSQSGVYTCGANNTLGSVERNITLVVNFAPENQTHWKPRYVFANGTGPFELNCTITANPEVTISWLFNKSKLNHKSSNVSETIWTKDIYHTSKSSVMKMIKLDKSMQGTYQCIGINHQGRVTYTTQLVVEYPPTVTPSFSATDNMTESATPYKLQCTVESNPKPEITWHFNGKIHNKNISEVVIELTDYKSVVQSTLSFPNGVTKENHGIYTCNATNKLGTDSKTVEINVWYGPHFLSHLNGTVNRTRSSNVSFECRAEGHPAPTLKWFKSYVPLSNVPVQTVSASKTKTIVYSVLTLDAVAKNQTAEYKCEVENIAGKKNQFISLNVLFEPVLVAKPPNITANKSQRVELNCYAEANPPVSTYNWTKNGKRLIETGPVYRIPSAEESSTGIYSCTPINALGSAGTITFNLYVQVPAFFTKKISCTETPVDWKCSCNGHGVPRPMIYWTKDNATKSLGTGTSFNVTKKRGNNGNYHCHIKNSLGQVSQSFLFSLSAVQPLGQWTAWTSCNVSCGLGYQERTRICNFHPCPEHLEERQQCNGTCVTSPNVTIATTVTSGVLPQTGTKEDTLTIVMYVLIPVLLVMCIVLVVWLANARGCRRDDKEFIVPLNNNLSQPPSIRSMQTRRGIYLPDNNFGVLNSGYRPEENEIGDANMHRNKFDTVEVEMQFGNETSDMAMDEPSNGSMTISVLDGSRSAETNGIANNQDNLSFYNSTYSHF